MKAMKPGNSDWYQKPLEKFSQRFKNKDYGQSKMESTFFNHFGVLYEKIHNTVHDRLKNNTQETIEIELIGFYYSFMRTLKQHRTLNFFRFLKNSKIPNEISKLWGIINTDDKKSQQDIIVAFVKFIISQAYHYKNLSDRDNLNKNYLEKKQLPSEILELYKQKQINPKFNILFAAILEECGNHKHALQIYISTKLSEDVPELLKKHAESSIERITTTRQLSQTLHTAIALSNDQFCSRDYSRAIQTLEEDLCRTAEGNIKLAEFYTTGIGTLPDITKASKILYDSYFLSDDPILLEKLISLLRKNDDNADCCYYVSKCYLNGVVNDHVKAAEYLKKVKKNLATLTVSNLVKVNKRLAEIYLLCGDQLLSEGNFDAARGKYEQAKDLSVNDVSAIETKITETQKQKAKHFLTLAKKAHLKRNYKEEKTNLDHVIKIGQCTTSAYCMLANAYINDLISSDQPNTSNPQQAEYFFIQALNAAISENDPTTLVSTIEDVDKNKRLINSCTILSDFKYEILKFLAIHKDPKYSDPIIKNLFKLDDVKSDVIAAIPALGLSERINAALLIIGCSNSPFFEPCFFSVLKTINLNEGLEELIGFFESIKTNTHKNFSDKFNVACQLFTNDINATQYAKKITSSFILVNPFNDNKKNLESLSQSNLLAYALYTQLCETKKIKENDVAARKETITNLLEPDLFRHYFDLALNGDKNAPLVFEALLDIVTECKDLAVHNQNINILKSRYAFFLYRALLAENPDEQHKEIERGINEGEDCCGFITCLCELIGEDLYHHIPEGKKTAVAKQALLILNKNLNYFCKPEDKDFLNNAFGNLLLEPNAPSMTIEDDACAPSAPPIDDSADGDLAQNEPLYPSIDSTTTSSDAAVQTEFQPTEEDASKKRVQELETGQDKLQTENDKLLKENASLQKEIKRLLRTNENTYKFFNSGNTPKSELPDKRAQSRFLRSSR